jgi:hypothetical protein
MFSGDMFVLGLRPEAEPRDRRHIAVGKDPSGLVKKRKIGHRGAG